MSKANNKDLKKKPVPPAPKKKTEPATINQEFYENRMKERERKLYSEEREAFAQWLTEHEAARAAVYLRCADNMERMCQRWQEHFYGRYGDKIVLPLKRLQEAIAGSSQLTEEHRTLFRGAVDAYLRYRGLNLAAKPEAAPPAAASPARSQLKTAASAVKTSASTVKTVSGTRKAPAAEPRSPRTSRRALGGRTSRQAAADPQAVSHTELVKRLDNMADDVLGDDLDYGKISALLTRLNSEFAEHELLGDIALSDEEYRLLKGYFRTTCRANYARHLQAAANPDLPEALEDESFALDKPSLIAMTAIGGRVSELDLWDELAKLVYGADSDRFDAAWLESAFARGMMRWGKAMAQTNKQRVLNTILMHAKRG